MANTRLSDLAAGSAVADTDLVYVVETAGVGGVKKTFTQIKEWTQDVLNATVIGGTNITATYNDGLGTLTFDFTGTIPADTDDLPEGSALYFTDERAQDAVGAMVGASLIYVDGTPLLARAALTGDVTAAQDSNATTIANDAVTYAKMQNASAGFVVLGKAATGSGDYAEIAAGADSVLRRSGSGDLAFGTIVTNNIGDDQVTYAKVQDVSATDRILGRSTAGAGIIEEIACTATGRSILDDASVGAVRTTLGLDTTANLTANIGMRFSSGSVADDTAVELVVGSLFGSTIIVIGNVTSAGVGEIFARTASAVASEILFQGSAAALNIVAGDGTLSGTTGTDGKCNLRMDSSGTPSIWLENRLGLARSWTIYVFPLV